MKRPLTVGHYSLGNIGVRLMLSGMDGARINTNPGDNDSIPLIEIGWQDDWAWLCDCLLHESFELYYVLHGLRFESDNNHDGATGDKLFVFDHTQHQRACSAVGMLISECLPDLASAHRQWKRKA